MIRILALACLCFLGVVIPSFAQLQDAPPLIIRGFDTKVDDCGSQQVLLTPFEDIKQGFEFNISSGKYSDSSNDFDTNSSLDVVKVSYIGPDTIRSGSNICIFFYCVDKNTDIDILVDGDIKTNDFQFSFRDNSFGNKMLFPDGSRELFITKGSFFEYQGKTLLNGKVYDGLSFSESNNTVPSALNGRDIRIDIGDLPSDGSDAGGGRDSLYGFVLCGDFDICTGEYEITKRVNWVVAVGTSQRELEALCDELCEFREEEEEEEEVVCEDELIITNLSLAINNYSVCFDPKAVTLVTGIVIDGVNIFSDPIFSSEYCANGLASGCVNFCSNGVTCAEPHLANDLAEYFDQEGILYESIIVSQFGSGLCVTINETNANIEEVIIDASNIGTQIYSFTETYVDFVYYALVEIDCNIAEILWDDGTSNNPKEVDITGGPMLVTVTCDDGCIYEGQTTVILFKPTVRNNTENIRNSLTISLYPNPASNEVTVNVFGDSNSHLELDIVGVDGKVYPNLIQSIILNQHGEVRHKFDISELQNGVYVLRSKQKANSQVILFTVVK